MIVYASTTSARSHHGITLVAVFTLVCFVLVQMRSERTASTSTSAWIAVAVEERQQQQHEHTEKGIPGFPSAAKFPSGFPSSPKLVEQLFAIPSTPTPTPAIPLNGSIESFQRVFQHHNRSATVFGEASLKKHAQYGKHFYSLPEFDEERGGVALFNNAFVAGRIPLVYNGDLMYYPDGCWTWEPPPGEKLVIGKTKLSPKKAIQVVEIDTAVLIAQYWGDKYFHGMLENLPRLAYVAEFLAANPHATVLSYESTLMSENRTEQYWNPSLIQGSPQWMSYEPDRQAYHVKRLLVPTSTRCGATQPVPLQILQSRLGGRSSTSSSGTLSRSDSDWTNNNTKNTTVTTTDDQASELLVILVQKRSKRGLKNHVELIEALVRNFEKKASIRVNDDSQTMTEYALLHNEANVIIGPHGAGFANLVFTNKERLKGMIEIFGKKGNGPNGGPNSCNQHTANILGVPFIRQQVAWDGAERFGQSFTANVSQVIEWVDEILQHKTAMT